MNDNQDKKDSLEENDVQPITKKIAKFSAFIYLGLAILVVIVATVGIFSVSYDYETSIEPVSLPDISFGDGLDVTVPHISETSPVPQIPEASSPVINEESDVEADVSMPEEEEIVSVFCYPVLGEVSKEYSMDKLVFSETMKDYRVHSGVDIAAEVGSDVVCFADGTISSVTEDYFYGVTVAVTHNNGMVSYYMNLDPLLPDKIAVGNDISAGDKIGNLGKTARCENSDPSHLHFELKVNGSLVNPVDYLPDNEDIYH